VFRILILQNQISATLARIQNQVAALEAKQAESNGIIGLIPNPDRSPRKKTPPDGFYTNEYASACGLEESRVKFDNNTQVDYLGLKNVLNNLVEEQGNLLYHGIPNVTLDTLTLTVSFQIIG
jgi:hypothetical protein